MENKLLNSIREWVNKNRKIFWRYEVTFSHETYIISVANLPNPSERDITVSPNNRLLKNDQKTQLYNNIIKVCEKPGVLNNSSINIKIDYVDGAVIAILV